MAAATFCFDSILTKLKNLPVLATGGAGHLDLPLSNGSDGRDSRHLRGNWSGPAQLLHALAAHRAVPSPQTKHGKLVSLVMLHVAQNMCCGKIACIMSVPPAIQVNVFGLAGVQSRCF